MNCSDVLQMGLFNYNERRNQEETFHSIIKWFDFNKYQTKEKTENALYSAGIKLPEELAGISFNLDGTWGKSRKENYSEALKELLIDERYHKQDFYEVNITVASPIVEAWTTCMLDRAGLFAQALYNKDTAYAPIEEIIIEVKYSPIDPDNPSTIYLSSKKLAQELQASMPGCKLVPFPRTKLSAVSPFYFKILRKRTLRTRASQLIIRTEDSRGNNNPQYSTYVQLAALPNENPPTYVHEYNTNREILASDKGGREVNTTIRNLKKNKPLFVNVSVQFYVNGLEGGYCEPYAVLDGEQKTLGRVSLNGEGWMHYWINFGPVAWLPGMERKVFASVGNHEFRGVMPGFQPKAIETTIWYEY